MFFISVSLAENIATKVFKYSIEKTPVSILSQKGSAEKEQVLKLYESISYPISYMSVTREDTPAYYIPTGIKNPYDAKELFDYVSLASEDKKISFNSLIYLKLPAGTVVKTLFSKTDVMGNEWICVFINRKIIESGPVFLFVKKENLSPSSPLSDKYYFSSNFSLLKSWKSTVVDTFYSYDCLWNVNLLDPSHFIAEDGSEYFFSDEFDSDSLISHSVHIINPDGYEEWYIYTNQMRNLYWKDSWGVEKWIEYDVNGNVISEKTGNIQRK